jgi:hypothetical protein
MLLRAALAVFALGVVACAGPTQGPTSAPQPTGGGGSGEGNGSGGNGTTTPPVTPMPAPPDGGTTARGLGCNGYVACLTAATSEADADACDAQASANANSILDAIDTCVLNVCQGNTGGATRCRVDAEGNPENLDGAPAFDASSGAPTGDCGDCLDNGEAALWSEPCDPSNDPACNTTACAQQTAACQADM